MDRVVQPWNKVRKEEYVYERCTCSRLLDHNWSHHRYTKNKVVYFPPVSQNWWHFLRGIFRRYEMIPRSTLRHIYEKYMLGGRSICSSTLWTPRKMLEVSSLQRWLLWRGLHGILYIRRALRVVTHINPHSLFFYYLTLVVLFWQCPYNLQTVL